MRILKQHLIVLLIAVLWTTSAWAQSLLVSESQDYRAGYGWAGWGDLNAGLDAAFDSVTVVPNLEDLSQLLEHDAIWVDQRMEGALTHSERSNLQEFAETGRPIVMMGDNGGWHDWNISIVAVGGGTVSGNDLWAWTPTAVEHELTRDVEAVSVKSASTANGGLSLFEDNVITLWGIQRNILTILDLNPFLDQFQDEASNAQFTSNVVAWLSGPGFALIAPADGASFSAAPRFVWTDSSYDLFLFYSIFDYEGFGYYPIPLWGLQTSFIMPNGWWDALASGRDHYWLVVGINSSTLEYEISDVYSFTAVQGGDPRAEAAAEPARNSTGRAGAARQRR